MNCPKCSDTDLKQEQYEGVAVHRCPNCQGLFLDHDDLGKLLALEDINGIDNPEFTEISERQDMVTGRCGRCGVEMEPVWGPANMRLDRCPQCKGVFLDQGELAAVKRDA